jgi:3-oxoacyl-[acyl-carrier-protein] synthase-3
MQQTTDAMLEHLLERLREVQSFLGVAADAAVDADAPLGKLLDSMALVEYVAVLAEDCAVSADVIEHCAGLQFGTVRQLAVALAEAGITCAQNQTLGPLIAVTAPIVERMATCWLSSPVLLLPELVQRADELDALLDRPSGWLIRHAGICQRHIWGAQDPVTVAAAAGLASLRNAGLLAEDVETLLVTSEASPLPAGMAAVLHHRLNLRPKAVALEVGGACTGFLSALWLAQRLLGHERPPQVVGPESWREGPAHVVSGSRQERVSPPGGRAPRTPGVILVIALEAPSLYLHVKPGPTGETAALFGDGAAACVLSRQTLASTSLSLLDVELRSEGGAADLLQVLRAPPEGFEIHMEGTRLAGVAVRTMATGVLDQLAHHKLDLGRVQAIIAHGGNGRMPGLLARRLGLPSHAVWSATETTGNLGSVSLPAAWALHADTVAGPLAWAAVGAGLTGAWALTGK